VRGDTWWGAVSGVEPAGNRIRLFSTYPLALDRGDIATGGEADGEGELVPPPLSLTLQPSYFSPATPPAPSQGYPYASAGIPTPPAPAALLPRPLLGAGSVRGDTWWAAVPGVEPAGNRIRLFSRISPCTGPWGYRHGGWRLAGRGNEFPLPCLSRSNHLASRRHPHPARTFLPVKHTLLPAPPPRPRLRQGIPILFCRHPHPARACGAPPPPPPGGGVRAWRYQVSSRARLFSRISPCTGPWGYRHGGWG